jgi:hypothetical protein
MGNQHLIACAGYLGVTDLERESVHVDVALFHAAYVVRGLTLPPSPCWQYAARAMTSSGTLPNFGHAGEHSSPPSRTTPPTKFSGHTIG